jgi:hypothetical protein
LERELPCSTAADERAGGTPPLEKQSAIPGTGPGDNLPETLEIG